jgi:hypothetical protein
MWYQHLIYFIIMLILSTILLLSMGALTFLLAKFFLKNDIVDIISAGAIILALSTLFAPIVGEVYPFVFGPDASDFYLSAEPTYLKINYDCNSSIMSINDSSDIEGQKPSHAAPMNLHNRTLRVKLYAYDVNPFITYDYQIRLNATPPGCINVTTSKPVIRTDMHSYIDIELNESMKPDVYSILFEGHGGDGKTRECMIVLEIIDPVHCKISIANFGGGASSGRGTGGYF